MPKLGPEDVSVQVRLKDRLNDQLHRRLDHPVSNGGNAQWSFATSGFRDYHPPHRLWLMRLGTQFFPEAGQPLLQPCRLDYREGLSIHARRSVISPRQPVGMKQHIFHWHLTPSWRTELTGLNNLFRCPCCHRNTSQ